MKNTEPVIITKKYIMKHRTPRGAWTRVQIQALGISWPPSQGWIGDLEGVVLSPQQAHQFETGKAISAKQDRKQSTTGIDHAINSIIKRQSELNSDHLIKLATVIGNARRKT